MTRRLAGFGRWGVGIGRGLRSADRGSMAVEVVVITPLLVMFMLLAVAGGRMVTAQSQIEAASRDAVRAASVERSAGAASTAGRTVAESQLVHLEARGDCPTIEMRGAFVAGGTISVFVQCNVPLDGLGLIGLPGSVSIESESFAPIDTYVGTR